MLWKKRRDLIKYRLYFCPVFYIGLFYIVSIEFKNISFFFISCFEISSLSLYKYLVTTLDIRLLAYIVWTKASPYDESLLEAGLAFGSHSLWNWSILRCLGLLKTLQSPSGTPWLSVLLKERKCPLRFHGWKLENWFQYKNIYCL